MRIVESLVAQRTLVKRALGYSAGCWVSLDLKIWGWYGLLLALGDVSIADYLSPEAHPTMLTHVWSGISQE